MLKMEYFNFRLLLGVLLSKQVSGRWWHHSVYSVNVRGSFKLSTVEGTVLPPGTVMPQVTLYQNRFETLYVLLQVVAITDGNSCPLLDVSLSVVFSRILHLL